MFKVNSKNICKDYVLTKPSIIIELNFIKTSLNFLLKKTHRKKFKFSISMSNNILSNGCKVKPDYMPRKIENISALVDIISGIQSLLFYLYTPNDEVVINSLDYISKNILDGKIEFVYRR